MPSRTAVASAVLALCAAWVHAAPKPSNPMPQAAAAQAAAPAPISAPPLPRNEPAVQRTVIEDDNARIEELRVRGEVRRIVVTPRNGAKPYEVIPADGGREMAPGHGSRRGAAGQRVWNVLDF